MAKGVFEDLTGKSFGRLTVIERTKPRIEERAKFAWWKCKCECGNMIDVRSSELKRMHTKSCGCLNEEWKRNFNEHTGKVFKDLTGQRYGRLVVVRRENNKQPFSWLCQCDCGKTKIIRGTDLKLGKTKSCGCYRKEKNRIDLTGMRFGKLVAVSLAEKNKNKHVTWNCICDCGTKVVVPAGSLRSGHSKSCGCLHLESLGLKPGEGAFNVVFKAYRKRATQKGFEFALSVDEFTKIIKSACAYCGDELTAERKPTNNGIFYYTGIDRIDSNKGYTLENSISCCKICNRAKNSMPQEEFISWLKRVSKHWKEA